MSDYFYVNSDWSAIVPAGSEEAAYGVQAKDVKRLGLDKLAGYDGADAPTVQQAEATKVLTSANLIPDLEPEPAPAAPEAKEAETPANKAAPKPANKGAARKEPVDGDRN